jgi:hypothetical protein
VSVDFTFTLQSGEPPGTLLAKLVSYYERGSPSAEVIERKPFAVVLRRGSVFGINLGIKTIIEILSAGRSASSSAASVTYKVHSIVGGEFARANFREKLSQEIETFKIQFTSDLGVREHRFEAEPNSTASELDRLADLLEKGLLTRDEFEAAKKKIIG